MINRFWRYLLITFCALLVAACASPTKNMPTVADTFMRSGRFALNYQSNLQKPYAAQGGFQWLDNGASLNISLNNPMGSILARIKIDNTQSVLTYADGKTQSANSPDELLALVWGHEIPVSGLRYWIRGELYPDAETSHLKQSNGDLSSFQQLGWQVSLSDYDKLGPKKIRLVREDAQSRLNLRFIIN